MLINNKLLILKIINKIPRPILLKIGYSKIGSKIVRIIKEKQSKKWFDVGNDVKMYLDITNPYTWDLINGNEHEDNVKQTFVDNIHEGNTVIDVGANIGEFSLIASKIIGKKGKIISIDPLNQAIIWLNKNYILNNSSNYEILEKAVGDKTGTMTLYKKNEVSEMGLLDPDIVDQTLLPSGEITVDTIDNIISSRNIDNVEMLKIDVEGFEYEVLCGCKNSFKEKKIKKIICEIHSSYLRKKNMDENVIYSMLKKNGFSIKNIDVDEDRSHILATL